MRFLLTLALAVLLGLYAIPANASGSTYTTVYSFIQKHSGKKAAKKYTSLIVTKAHKHKLPPLIIASVIVQESDFDPHCVTGSCVGLMQVNPELWAKPGENMYRPEDNLEAGCRLLSRLKGRFGDWPQALTAYNYGENHRVTRSVGFSRYAKKVLGRVYYNS